MARAKNESKTLVYLHCFANDLRNLVWTDGHNKVRGPLEGRDQAWNFLKARRENARMVQNIRTVAAEGEQGEERRRKTGHANT